MTYNFDPDKWHEDQLLCLNARLKQGELTRSRYDAEVLDLEQRLAEMWSRLDGTYRIERAGDS